MSMLYMCALSVMAVRLQCCCVVVVCSCVVMVLSLCRYGVLAVELMSCFCVAMVLWLCG